MTNTNTAIAANAGTATSVLALGGWTISDMLEAAADSVIDQHRFESEYATDRVLARYEDDVPALMPSSDELSEAGVDIVGLARALQAGLDARLFGAALASGMLDIDSLNSELAAGLDIACYNEGLAHLADIVAERNAHPDIVDLILCRHGDCCDDSQATRH